MAKPEKLIGDKAYDSDDLDDDLRKKGIEMMVPHRSNRLKGLRCMMAESFAAMSVGG